MAAALTGKLVEKLRKRSGWAPRQLLAYDPPRLAAWIEADPDHRGRVTTGWWLQDDPDSLERKKNNEFLPAVENYLVADRRGPLLFLRLSNAMRVDIQFAPDEEVRTAMALAGGVPWLALEARKRRYAQLIFESRAPKLVKFLGRMGFHPSAAEQIMNL